ncbi:hypothetical protein BH11PSE11_BH11PSE11_09870 [soil metagenome]
MRKTLLVAGIAAIFLAGCAAEYSEAPRPTNYSIMKQKKVQAASHWDLIANDVAEQIKNSVGSNELLYVTPPVPNSEFNHAFHNSMISALVNKGVRVSTNGDTKAMQINVETQLVRFSPARFQNGRFVSTTAIAAGLMAIHGLHLAAETNAGIGILGITGAIDFNNWVEREYANGNTPQSELIVTTSAVNSTQYVARRTDVYYISDPDGRLYAPRPVTPSVKITGGA